MKQRSGVVEATWAMILPTKAANCGVGALAAVGVHPGRRTTKSTTLHTLRRNVPVGKETVR